MWYGNVTQPELQWLLLFRHDYQTHRGGWEPLRSLPSSTLESDKRICLAKAFVDTQTKCGLPDMVTMVTDSQGDSGRYW